MKEIEVTDEVILVHHDCHRRFVGKRKKSDEESFSVKRLRSSVENSFNWEVHNFTCGETADINTDRDKVKKAMTLQLGSTMIKHGQGRGDHLGDAVLGRLESYYDIVAEEAV